MHTHTQTNIQTYTFKHALTHDTFTTTLDSLTTHVSVYDFVNWFGCHLKKIIIFKRQNFYSNSELCLLCVKLPARSQPNFIAELQEKRKINRSV